MGGGGVGGRAGELWSWGCGNKVFTSPAVL